jgi:predicted outer membrane repeat protein
MILLFDGNEAGAAGGGFYTTCFSIGTWCRKALDKTIGLPSPFGSDGRVLSFVANQAGGYGQQMATAPSALVVGSSRQTYVPGKTFLNESLWILDATGQIIAGNPRRPINHMIQLLVVPVQAECTTFESCEQLKLQATDSFLSDGMAEMTSLLDYDILLQYCHLDSPDVNIMFFVSGSHFLDVTGADESDLTTLRRTLTISCSQCEPGWSRREMEIIDGQGTKQRVWTCSPCSRNQYVIDSNQHKCEQCPAGVKQPRDR